MEERTGVIKAIGNPVTLVGAAVNVGDKAPDFTVLDNELNPKTLADFAGKALLIATVPSLDTPVCDVETRRFNQEAADLADDIVILTISTDLPFAQARWCGAAGIEKVVTLSDHKETDFGVAYGVLIKELRLLARAIFVVDKNGVVTHTQLTGDITEEPDYDAALAAAKAAL